MASLLFSTSLSQASKDEGEPVQLPKDAFDKYFNSTSNDLDGGEIQIHFSENFIGMFSETCEITTHITIYNTDGKLTDWNQSAAVSFTDLPPRLLEKQSFYVGGLGKNLRLNLIYYAEGCKTEKGSFKFEFNITEKTNNQSAS